MARAGSSPYEAKQRRKQGFLASLAKLEDRDTQTAAVSELNNALKVMLRPDREPHHYLCPPPSPSCSPINATQTHAPFPSHLLVQALDADSLPLFISCVSSSNDKQKVFARKVSGVMEPTEPRTLPKLKASCFLSLLCLCLRTFPNRLCRAPFTCAQPSSPLPPFPPPLTLLLLLLPVPFAPQESTRLLGQLAADQCPMSQEAMAQPHVGKVIASVKAKFKVPPQS